MTEGRMFFRTKAAQIALQSLDRIAEEQIIGMVVARPGCGKSECIAQWRERTKVRHAWIEADVLTSPRPILNALVRALAIATGSNMAHTKCLIEEALARDPLMLILDEGDLLTVRAMDLLRSIWDRVSVLRGTNGESGFPLALFGTPKLRQMLDHTDLERLHRRIFHVAQLPPLTREELKGIVAKKWPEFPVEADAVEDLFVMSHAGSFGWVNNIMRVATRLAVRNGRSVSTRVLKAVRNHLDGLGEDL